MDTGGIAFAAVAGLVSAVALVWHFQQVKKRPATGHDKLMAAAWAAILVMSVGRVIALVIAGDAPPPDSGG